MRYIPHTEQDIQQMLEAIGVSSIRELFQDIPDDLYIRGRAAHPAWAGRACAVSAAEPAGFTER
jgi:glycine cleavage system pyridoxal-binding protein P